MSGDIYGPGVFFMILTVGGFEVQLKPGRDEHEFKVYDWDKNLIEDRKITREDFVSTLMEYA